MTRSLLSIITLLVLASGCALAPMNTTTSASSLGAGKKNLELNLVAPGVSFDVGVAHNWDVGAAVEYQGFGFVYQARTKYSFINQDRGFSLASLAGLGVGDDLGKAKFVYAGPILSYRTANWEYFASYRFNFVRWDGEINTEDRSDMFHNLSLKSSVTYNQLELGITRYGKVAHATLGLRVIEDNGDSEGRPFVNFGVRF